MDTTLLLAKVIGPVLIVRGISLLIDRQHFRDMLAGLEREVTTVAFSFVPIAIMMAGLALVATIDARSSYAALLFYLMGWGAIVKGTLLILFPRAVVAKAQFAGRMGFLCVVTAVCLAVGIYLTWFGYFGPRAG